MAWLDGKWRFHTGDDPRWADPGFDDSAWPLLNSNAPWSRQGYKGYGGTAWYRFQVVLPAKHDRLALFISDLRTSYQVFADGRMIAQFGGMPPHRRVDQGMPGLFYLPADASTAGYPLEIAIRVWHWPVWARYVSGGPYQAPLIGSPGMLDAWKDYYLRDTYWRMSSNTLQFLIAVVAGLAALGFFALHPSDREYLWFGAYEVTIAANCAITNLRALQVHVLRPGEISQSFITVTGDLFFLAFLWTILRQRRSALYWTAVISASIAQVPLLLGEWGFLTPSQLNLWLNALYVPYMVITLLILTRESRRRSRDATLLLAPVFFAYLEGLLEGALAVFEQAGHTHFYGWVHWVYHLASWPFPFSLGDVASVVMQLAILSILVLRFARLRRDKQRFASELEAARAVQHVLIPEEIPAIPGLHIEAVYKPAGEVGGDFFQIIPLPSGSALVAVGDVSGKGMPAAMTVSLLVGTLRTLAQFTGSPAAILSGMNERLVGRSGGFTTCLVARIDPDAAVTLANAGHLAPYLRQQEIAVECGLPLGISGDTRYAQTTLRLAETDQLTLITDGVIEARSKHGELFGFERAAVLASEPAHSIAEAAQRFGQEDDITVLKLTRSADGKTTQPQMHLPTLLPSAS